MNIKNAFIPRKVVKYKRNVLFLVLHRGLREVFSVLDYAEINSFFRSEPCYRLINNTSVIVSWSRTPAWRPRAVAATITSRRTRPQSPLRSYLRLYLPPS